MFPKPPLPQPKKYKPRQVKQTNGGLATATSITAPVLRTKREQLEAFKYTRPILHDPHDSARIARVVFGAQMWKLLALVGAKPQIVQTDDEQYITQVWETTKLGCDAQEPLLAVPAGTYAKVERLYLTYCGD